MISFLPIKLTEQADHIRFWNLNKTFRNINATINNRQFRLIC